MLIAFYKITKRFGRDIGMIFEKFSLMNIRISTPLQEQIISLLCRENNLFVVGDIKQSIYGFRFADHTLFRRRYDSYSKKKMEKERG